MAKINVTGNDLIKHTAAIHVSNTISIIERKISNILLKNSFPYLTHREKHCISIKYIAELLGWSSYKNYELIKLSLKKLNATQIEWNILKKDKKNEWGVTTIISSAKIKNGICEYSYSPALRELLAMPNIYAKLNMAVQAKFSSKYSLALWEFLIEMLCSSNTNNITTSFIELENIKKILGIERAKIYEEFKVLNRDVLKKAILEINLISDITVECIVKRENKKVIAVAFKVIKKEDFDYPLLNLELDASDSEMDLEAIEVIQEKDKIMELLIAEFNISFKKAREIIETYSLDKINQTMNYIRTQSNNSKIKNKAAYFASSLKENWNHAEVVSQSIQVKDITYRAIEDNHPLWASILKCLNDTLGTEVYTTWLSKLQFDTYDPQQKFLYLKAETVFFKDWIENNYKKDILKATQNINPSIQEIEITC